MVPCNRRRRKEKLAGILRKRAEETKIEKNRKETIRKSHWVIEASRRNLEGFTSIPSRGSG